MFFGGRCLAGLKVNCIYGTGKNKSRLAKPAKPRTAVELSRGVNCLFGSKATIHQPPRGTATKDRGFEGDDAVGL